MAFGLFGKVSFLLGCRQSGMVRIQRVLSLLGEWKIDLGIVAVVGGKIAVMLEVIIASNDRGRWCSIEGCGVRYIMFDGIVIARSSASPGDFEGRSDHSG